MRTVFEEQMKIGETDIDRIQFDLKSRDEIPKLLTGLQYIHRVDDLRKQVFALLENLTPEHIDPQNGRRGMDYWKILVLGTIRLACNFDYDKLKEIADNHLTLRRMLCHPDWDTDTYALQTIKDNVSLLTPDILDSINRCVVVYGHGLLGKNERDAFHARCDSFVVETNVHYPTDINLLLDAMRKAISLTAIVCADAGITGWRKHRCNYRKLKKLYRKAQKLKRSTSKDPKKAAQRDRVIREAYLAYMDQAVLFLEKAETIVEKLRCGGSVDIARLIALENYAEHARRQIEQIYRRVLLKEKIPHDEKVFSIFEEHTEWISKGKAGVPQELGLRVCVVEDQYGFIVHHQVMEEQTDKEIAVPIVKEAKKRFPNLTGCSFDKGFYTPNNVKELNSILDNLVLPKKGKPTQKEKERYNTEEFVQARKQHAAVESAINALENHGLDRCPDRGIDAFLRYISLSVLSRNIQILGHILQQKELKKETRRKKYRETWNSNRTETKPEEKAA
jgi:hypothetical protein